MKTRQPESSLIHVGCQAARAFGTAPVAATAMPCQRYGAFMQPCQAGLSHLKGPARVSPSVPDFGWNLAIQTETVRA